MAEGLSTVGKSVLTSRHQRDVSTLTLAQETLPLLAYGVLRLAPGIPARRLPCMKTALKAKTGKLLECDGSEKKGAADDARRT
jgi:hypothetical protein